MLQTTLSSNMLISNGGLILLVFVTLARGDDSTDNRLKSLIKRLQEKQGRNLGRSNPDESKRGVTTFPWMLMTTMGWAPKPTEGFPNWFSPDNSKNSGKFSTVGFPWKEILAEGWRPSMVTKGFDNVPTTGFPWKGMPTGFWNFAPTKGYERVHTTGFPWKRMLTAGWSPMVTKGLDRYPTTGFPWKGIPAESWNPEPTKGFGNIHTTNFPWKPVSTEGLNHLVTKGFQKQLQTTGFPLSEWEGSYKQQTTPFPAVADIPLINEAVELNPSPFSSVPLGRDCAEIKSRYGEAGSGVYPISIPNNPTGSVPVYCEMDAAGGGWTIIQRRFDGNTDFDRTWEEYSAGFGQANSEYWIGNDNLAALTSSSPQALYISMLDKDHTQHHAEYTHFLVGDSESRYQLVSAGKYSGSAGDSLTYLVGQPFSTPDQDNVAMMNEICAKNHHGGWWFRDCYESNLNGFHRTGIVWKTLTGYGSSLERVVMMIRPQGFA